MSTELLATKAPEPLPRLLTHQLIDVDAWLVELARDAGLDERDIEIAERGFLLDESPADIAGDLGFAEKAEGFTSAKLPELRPGGFPGSTVVHPSTSS